MGSLGRLTVRWGGWSLYTRARRAEVAVVAGVVAFLALWCPRVVLPLPILFEQTTADIMLSRLVVVACAVVCGCLAVATPLTAEHLSPRATVMYAAVYCAFLLGVCCLACIPLAVTGGVSEMVAAWRDVCGLLGAAFLCAGLIHRHAAAFGPVVWMGAIAATGKTGEDVVAGRVTPGEVHWWALPLTGADNIAGGICAMVCLGLGFAAVAYRAVHPTADNPPTAEW